MGAVALKPWSFSSLNDFTTCARKFHAERILKTAEDEETEAKRIGTEMHKHFELRLDPAIRRALPDDMEQFEPFMREVESAGGEIRVERKVGLNKRLEPVDFFAKDVWWRGVLDVHQVLPNGRHRIIDYKTGKKRPKVRQLHLFSIFAMIEGATEVESMLYWTQDMSRTKLVFPRFQLGPLLSGLVEDLDEYREAHQLDIWPPKRNHLCRNHCSVDGCEYLGKGMYDR